MSEGQILCDLSLLQNIKTQNREQAVMNSNTCPWIIKPRLINIWKTDRADGNESHTKSNKRTLVEGIDTLVNWLHYRHIDLMKTITKEKMEEYYAPFFKNVFYYILWGTIHILQSILCISDTCGHSCINVCLWPISVIFVSQKEYFQVSQNLWVIDPSSPRKLLFLSLSS